MGSATATAEKRVLRVDCTGGGRDIMREILEYRVGPAAEWTFVDGTCIIVGRADRVDADLRSALSTAAHEIEQEYATDGIYDAAENADRLESELARTDIEAWDEATVDVEAVPPRDLSLDDLRDEYRDLVLTFRRGRRDKPPANYPEVERRAVAVWAAIRERVDERPPACPECDARDWTPAFAEPVSCAACGHTVHRHGRRANPDLVEAVFEAWRTMVGAEERGRDA